MPSSGPKVRLFIEKSTIYIKQFSGGFQNGSAFTDSSDILNKIHHQASLGGRLISIERNGVVIAQGASALMAGVRSGCGVTSCLKSLHSQAR